MALFAQPICQLLLYNQPEVAQEAAPLLTMLSLAIAFSGLLFTTNSILQSFGRTTQPVIDMAVGGVVKVALSYVLIGIPQVAAMGSAISTVASSVVMVVLNLIAIRSSLPAVCVVVFRGVSYDDVVMLPKGQALARLFRMRPEEPQRPLSVEESAQPLLAGETASQEAVPQEALQEEAPRQAPAPAQAKRARGGKYIPRHMR